MKTIFYAYEVDTYMREVWIGQQFIFIKHSDFIAGQ